MYDQQIQAARQRLAKAENIVRRLRRAVVDTESSDRIAGAELGRLKLELVKAEELASDLREALDDLSQLQREAQDMLPAWTSLGAISTAIHEGEVLKFNVWNFDVVQLANRGGVEGNKIWISPKPGRGRERLQSGRFELLIIYVDDDPRGSLAVKRVRDILGLNALPRKQSAA